MGVFGEHKQPNYSAYPINIDFRFDVMLGGPGCNEVHLLHSVPLSGLFVQNHLNLLQRLFTIVGL